MTTRLLKYGFPAAGAAMLVFAVFHVARTSPDESIAPPPHPPLQAPYLQTLAASGIVEARNGNTAVGAPFPGIVAQVLIEAGQKVSVGAPLFRLDDRALQADLRTRQAHLATAKAQLARLEQSPLAEEVLASTARVGEARATLAMHRARLQREQKLAGRELSNPQQVEELKAAVAAAREHLVQAEAADRQLRSGPTPAEKAVLRAGVSEAEAAVAQIKTELGRCTVCSPVQGIILRVNVHIGEEVGARSDLSPVILGEGPPFHLRVEIDEEQIARFRPDASACAVPHGQTDPSVTLRLVRVEPLVVPRHTFIGDPRERVDSRVLQVIYELKEGTTPLHVGQRLDVFISTENRGRAAASPGR
jgi:multidrug efflux pump subunit AcrA (membrane-fusion protein)